MTEQSKNHPSSTDPVLVAQDLEKSFGEGEAKVYALRKVNVSVRRGEFLTVMGPSGSGKTTLLTLLGGIDTPTSGKVLLEGENISSMSDTQLARVRRRRIGFVFQSFNLLPILTAEANVTLPLLLDEMPKREAQARAQELMEHLKIAHRRHHLPSALSGGEQQRVAVCRALAARPPIILADEPTGNLDTANSTELIHLLRALVDTDGQTIVMVTHDVNSAAVSDRVVICRDGLIHAEIARKDITIDNLTEHLKASRP